MGPRGTPPRTPAPPLTKALLAIALAALVPSPRPEWLRLLPLCQRQLRGGIQTPVSGGPRPSSLWLSSQNPRDTRGRVIHIGPADREAPLSIRRPVSRGAQGLLGLQAVV